MSDAGNPFRVVKTNWKVGDQREVPAPALDALRGTAAYDSYEQLYRIDGLAWRMEGKRSQADGSSVYILRCVNE